MKLADSCKKVKINNKKYHILFKLTLVTKVKNQVYQKMMQKFLEYCVKEKVKYFGSNGYTAK